MQIKIRHFQSLDYEDLCRVHDAARLQEMKLGKVEKYFTPFKEAPYWHNFFDSKIRIAEAEGKFAGFIAYKPHKLAYLYVDPKFQRHGIGDSLLTSALPNIKRPIRLEVFSDNLAAKSLYAKHGFKIIKTVKEPWWSDPKSNLVSSDTMELV